MHHPHAQRLFGKQVGLTSLFIALVAFAPDPALAQASPFMTGATSLQTNILAWLTPVAIILVMVLGGMAMANRIVENCGNTLILRCSASEGGGTARFASQLIGEREVLRTTVSRSSRDTEFLGSTSRSEHFSVEPAVLPSQIEQLPDLAGYLKHASDPQWHRVRLAAVRRWNEHRAAQQASPHTDERLGREGNSHE
ncbi:MAG TPA: type IV secretion system DNA-binding domain-containing protein [Steroidobacteraceae bacterium]|nr:type IV secretion system DNA-binding domain-containing protein [Steroidobacteraceae bacterium]